MHAYPSWEDEDDDRLVVAQPTRAAPPRAQRNGGSGYERMPAKLPAEPLRRATSGSGTARPPKRRESKRERVVIDDEEHAASGSDDDGEPPEGSLSDCMRNTAISVAAMVGLALLGLLASQIPDGTALSPTAGASHLEELPTPRRPPMLLFAESPLPAPPRPPSPP